MKNLIVSLSVIGLAISAEAGNYTTLLNGNFYTNNNVAYNSGTNGIGVVTNNFQLGTIPGSSNVFWYLSTTVGAQPGKGTNGYLPSTGFAPQGNYPNTLYGPYNNTLVGGIFQLVATNSLSTTVTAQFAGSIDGLYWQTNAFSLAWIVPVNSLSPTNGLETYGFTSGAWPYYALQQINNPGANAVTNFVLEATGKPGL